MATTIPPLAAVANITIEQGAHFALRILWEDSTGTPVDLTGYTAQWPMRSVDDNTLLLNPTSGTGEIVLAFVTDPNGDYNIAVDIDEAVTAALAVDSFRHNLELIPSSGETRRLIQGSGIVSAEVTGS